jgi:uncharacterized membrane protein YesL
MILLFTKKAFFDSWDNLLSLIFYNLLYLIVLALLWVAFEVFTTFKALGLFLLLFFLVLNAFYLSSLSSQTKTYVYYETTQFSSIFKNLFKKWQHSLLYAAIQVVLLSLLLIVVPFYFSFHSLLFYTIALALLWVALIVVFALMYYFPLAVTMHEDKPFKTLKKAFLLVVDNIGFTLYLALHTIGNLILTIFFVTLIPGAASIQLSHHVALKFLLHKYDYLEESEEANKKELPWDELLFEEDEKLGKRTFKGTIFPWRD